MKTLISFILFIFILISGITSAQGGVFIQNPQGQDMCFAVPHQNNLHIVDCGCKEAMGYNAGVEVIAKCSKGYIPKSQTQSTASNHTHQSDPRTTIRFSVNRVGDIFFGGLNLSDRSKWPVSRDNLENYAEGALRTCGLDRVAGCLRDRVKIITRG